MNSDGSQKFAWFYSFFAKNDTTLCILSKNGSFRVVIDLSSLKKSFGFHIKHNLPRHFQFTQMKTERLFENWLENFFLTLTTNFHKKTFSKRLKHTRMFLNKFYWAFDAKKWNFIFHFFFSIFLPNKHSLTFCVIFVSFWDIVSTFQKLIKHWI